MTERTIEAIALMVLALWMSGLLGLIDITVVIGVSSLTLLATAVANVYGVMDRNTTCIEALYERGEIF